MLRLFKTLLCLAISTPARPFLASQSSSESKKQRILRSSEKPERGAQGLRLVLLLVVRGQGGPSVNARGCNSPARCVYIMSRHRYILVPINLGQKPKKRGSHQDRTRIAPAIAPGIAPGSHRRSHRAIGHAQVDRARIARRDAPPLEKAHQLASSVIRAGHATHATRCTWPSITIVSV